MNFIYHSVSSSLSRTVPISLEELATNVITDWMPGTPISLSRGFVDLLHTVLESQEIGTDYFWTLKPVAAHFEKQWKQVTSWILGVAFCRKVIEMEGYPWWAPVSAFTKRNNVLSTLTPYWIQNLTRRHCRVKLPVPPLSNLMPDYVAARFNAINSQNEVSFAESKGCQLSLKSRSAPSESWRKQSRNAEFFYRKVRCPAVQNLVIATRVNPAAKKPITRRIHVRAWNSNNSTTAIPFDALRTVVSLHYFGICERIGLIENAKLLEMNRLLKSGIPLRILTKYPAFLDMTGDRLAGLAYEEMEKQTSSRLPQTSIFLAPKRSSFTIADRTLRIGLSEEALRLIRWLQAEDGESEKRVILQFIQDITRLQSEAEREKGILIRSDGIIGEFID